MFVITLALIVTLDAWDGIAAAERESKGSFLETCTLIMVTRDYKMTPRDTKYYISLIQQGRIHDRQIYWLHLRFY